MNETVAMILACIAGVGLGALFFGGLWFTVKKINTSKIPALWFLGSFLFRMGITLAGFYFIGAGNWQRLLICMIGFIAARFAVIHVTKAIDEKKIQVKHKILHEA